jgi:hypothetical protein
LALVSPNWDFFLNPSPSPIIAFQDLPYIFPCRLCLS